MAAPRLDAPGGEEAPRPDTAWWGVHAARYTFAARHLEADRVLDIACGTGYGLSILSPGARTCVGVDIDLAALREAWEAGPVAAGDGGALPFPDHTFDAVTTFETIEHLERRAEFLAELRRVLVPGGLLLLSTPNALYTRPVDGRPRNPFHVHEYTPRELEAELRTHFGDIRMLGQEISKEFKISPFWDDQQRLPRTVRHQARLLTWRVLNKLPGGLRDAASRTLWGHPLFPDENGYTFTKEGVTTAPVLVVVARSLRRG